MRIITDCPVVLGEWNLGGPEAAPADELSPALRTVWDAVGSDREFWSLEPSGPSEVCLMVVEKTDKSQFDQLVELTRKNFELPSRIACIALEGENFHGQSARPWTALRGNLHLSLYSRLEASAVDLQEEISILPTIALLDAFNLKGDAAEQTGIRWLNDLFIKGRKVAGTLAASQLDGDRFTSVVYGVGVNVESVPEVEPNPCVPEAASLRSTIPDAGWTVGKAAIALINALLRRIGELRDGIGKQFTDIYAKHSACLGQGVRVWPKKVTDFGNTKPIARGVLRAIRPDLTLIVDGADEPIGEGRLAFEEDCVELGL